MVLDYNYTSSVKYSKPMYHYTNIYKPKKTIADRIPNPINMPCKWKGKKKK